MGSRLISVSELIVEAAGDSVFSPAPPPCSWAPFLSLSQNKIRKEKKEGKEEKEKRGGGGRGEEGREGRGKDRKGREEKEGGEERLGNGVDHKHPMCI